mmetsp:Transcript_73528/g.195933  ORF Transcript_73528/g.195933 Transcript_73528/m.195933 type:complete len:320 (-) Transcript_73528:685-1644(-)
MTNPDRPDCSVSWHRCSTKTARTFAHRIGRKLHATGIDKLRPRWSRTIQRMCLAVSRVVIKIGVRSRRRTQLTREFICGGDLLPHRRRKSWRAKRRNVRMAKSSLGARGTLRSERCTDSCWRHVIVKIPVPARPRSHSVPLLSCNTSSHAHIRMARLHDWDIPAVSGIFHVHDPIQVLLCVLSPLCIIFKLLGVLSFWHLRLAKDPRARLDVCLFALFQCQHVLRRLFTSRTLSLMSGYIVLSLYDHQTSFRVWIDISLARNLLPLVAVGRRLGWGSKDPRSGLLRLLPLEARVRLTSSRWQNARISLSPHDHHRRLRR